MSIYRQLSIWFFIGNFTITKNLVLRGSVSAINSCILSKEAGLLSQPLFFKKSFSIESFTIYSLAPDNFFYKFFSSLYYFDEVKSEC